MLTDKEIEDAITAGVRAKKISWLGYKKYEHGAYTLPVLSKSDMQAARVIESAATAPLLERIAELEAAVFRDATALNYWKDKCAALERQLQVAKGEELDS